MGIAMIGTFDSIAPADTAIHSLRRLAAWKLVKEGLMSSGSFKHPVGDPNAIDLKGLAGHRDGCATDCPGQMLYARLNTLRKQTDSLELQCGVVFAGLPVYNTEKLFHVFPQPATDRLYITGSVQPGGYRILSITGQQVQQGTIAGNFNPLIDISGLKTGVYILDLSSINSAYRQMIIKN